MTREPRAITIAEIERQFELASYWYSDRWCPAVTQYADGTYGIRILRSETITGSSQTVSYDYFYLDPDGTITTAPRGYAKDYKPGRVVDIEAVAERYAMPPEGAAWISLGGEL